MSTRILLHACCAPCATVTVEEYAKAGFEPVLYFHNPNIHPYREFVRRLETIEKWAASAGFPLIVDRDYPLEANVTMLLASSPRCLGCARQRLSAAAEIAAANGCGFFGTTLSVSPYQNHEYIIQAGGEAEGRFGVKFAYLDCRRRYRDSIDISRALELYRQPYCGCVFSERDRYLSGRQKNVRMGIDTVP